MSSTLRTLLALVVIGAVLLWLGGPCVPQTDLGPAAAVVARPGVPWVVVARPQGQPRWWLAPAEARGAGALTPLPGEWAQAPALASDGSLVAVVAGSVVRLAAGGEGAPQPLGTPAAPTPFVLVGLDGAEEPVLVDGAGALHVRRNDRWLPLADEQGAAFVAEPSRVRLSPGSRALACPSAQGWEAWVWDRDPPRRVQARETQGADAVFSPNGNSLVLEGPLDGLFRLDLATGALPLMARGNLGSSRRVPFSAGFRGDPLVLVAPQRDGEGFLQIFQTQLENQARLSLTTGALHHYAPVVSPDGSRVAYLQSDFDEQAAGPEKESLYVHDFSQGHAVRSARRQAVPGPLQGPVFVGDGSALVLVVDGRAVLVRL